MLKSQRIRLRNATALPALSPMRSPQPQFSKPESSSQPIRALLFSPGGQSCTRHLLHPRLRVLPRPPRPWLEGADATCIWMASPRRGQPRPLASSSRLAKRCASHASLPAMITCHVPPHCRLRDARTPRAPGSARISSSPRGDVASFVAPSRNANSLVACAVRPLSAVAKVIRPARRKKEAGERDKVAQSGRQKKDAGARGQGYCLMGSDAIAKQFVIIKSCWETFPITCLLNGQVGEREE